MEISIVIMTYNRANYLNKCLNSLKNQDMPKDSYEIIVVDDGSIDNTEDIIKEFSKSLNIVYTKQSHRGISSARNRGAKSAKGPWILFMADDYIADKNLIKELLDLIKSYPDTDIFRIKIGTEGKNILSKISQFYIETSSLAKSNFPIDDNILKKIKFFFTLYPFPIKEAIINATIFGAVCLKKSLLDKYGYYNEILKYGEDTEMTWRLIGVGAISRYYSKELIKRSQNSSFTAMLLQQFKYGQGRIAVKRLSAQYHLSLDGLKGIIMNIGSIFIYPFWKCLQTRSIHKFFLYFPFIFLLNLANTIGKSYEIIKGLILR